LAGSFFRRERSDHTLQPTALVHEAFVKLVNQMRTEWRDGAHFLAVAAEAMRRLLIDHARKHAAARRQPRTIPRLSDEQDPTPALTEREILALDEAIRRLADLNARQAQVVTLRFFGGMTTGEVAHVLDVSENTIKGNWRMARARLQHALEGLAGR
jgi:RNA polymerase sigma factor (TIGR02999 family)